MLKYTVVRRILAITLALPALLAGADSKTTFDTASIRVNPPETGFHFAVDSGSGGPGSADPGMFRGSKCTLATLIAKAFELQNYQFPARTSLPEGTFEIAATIPAGTTPAEFQTMLQTLLKERFGLTFHFAEKKMRGYRLVVAKNGSKLKESGNSPRPVAAENHEQHGFAGHNGLMIFNGSARYRGDHQSGADIARLLSDQFSLPVNDQTGLQGKYDVSLAWSGAVAHSGGNHAEATAAGGWGGAGHMEHGGGGAAGSGASTGEPSGPTLFDAVQEQLGLRLVSAEQVIARIFTIDHVDSLPTAN